MCISFLLIFFPEVYAQREKSGVYIPKERYDREEMERKVSKLFSCYEIYSIFAMFWCCYNFVHSLFSSFQF